MKGNPSDSVVTLTIRNKSGDPEQVDVTGKVQMIDYAMLLKTVDQKLRPVLNRIITKETLRTIGLGDHFIPLSEIEKKVPSMPPRKRMKGRRRRKRLTLTC